MRNYKYFFSLIPGLLTVFGNSAGGNWVWTNFIFSLGVLPVLEWFVPEDRSNRSVDSPLIPDTILLLHALLQCFALTMLVRSVSLGVISGWYVIGAAFSNGVHSGSSSIVVSHELIHRKNKFLRMLGQCLLWSAGNIYFYIEHLRVHHKWVGTAKDPATALRGESLYAFFYRSIIGQIRGAWQLEAERLQKERKSVSGFHNRFLVGVLMLILIQVLLCQLAGWQAMAMFLLQWLLANFLLEYTNYIEHYGLVRETEGRVTEHYSWQTDKVISRFLLIDLSRHADHHYYAYKPYHRLDSYEESPSLPGGYTSAIYLALLPSLWFKVVDPRIDAFHSPKR